MNNQVEFIKQSESDFLCQIIELARLRGWLVHHTRPAWTSKGYRTPIQGDVGFPDLVLCRPPYLILVEVKSERGRLSEAQKLWIQALEVCTNADIRVWKPQDWSEIERVLW